MTGKPTPTPQLVNINIQVLQPQIHEKHDFVITMDFEEKISAKDEVELTQQLMVQPIGYFCGCLRDTANFFTIPHPPDPSKAG